MSVSIRSLSTLAELEACVRLQEETWGEGFGERVPVSILKIAPRLGGVVAGAFDPPDRMVAFVFGLTGVADGRPVHWSDMLAVGPDHRGAGIGRALKLHQREVLLARGVRTMHWTYDPLESRNAWLNLSRLGAVCREYVIDMYGPPSSPLHRGVGTDRFVVTWELDDPDTVGRLEGRTTPPDLGAVADWPVAFDVERREGVGPVPATVPPAPPDEPRFRVPVPADLQALKAADPGAAARWRAATRAVLEPALAAGWEVRGLVRDGPVSHYLVERGRAT